MNIKNLIFALVFAMHLTYCLEEKTWNMIVLGVGSALVIDNLVRTLPEFYKHDKHKKLNRESVYMAGKACLSVWYLHKTFNFLRKLTNDRYVMGSLDNKNFVDLITDILPLSVVI